MNRHLPVILLACLLASAAPRRAWTQIFVPTTDDAHVSNDLASGPGATNDRNDFVEIRYFENETTNRRRIGYFKYDITGLDPLLFAHASLTGGFANNRDGDGEFTVYGLNDGLTNADDDPTFTEANWTEGNLSFFRGLGVDNSVPNSLGNGLGIDLAEVTQLGSITLVDGEPLASNPTDLDLSGFLGSDTNGVVTLLLVDERVDPETQAPIGTEWRITAREASVEQSLRLTFTPLAGDTDLSGAVTLEDLTPIRTNYGAAGLSYTDGDLNSDNLIDFADFRMWKTGFLDGGGLLSDAIAAGRFLQAPEPGAALLALAAACVTMVGRRRP